MPWLIVQDSVWCAAVVLKTIELEDATKIGPVENACENAGTWERVHPPPPDFWISLTGMQALPSTPRYIPVRVEIPSSEVTVTSISPPSFVSHRGILSTNHRLSLTLTVTSV